MKILISGAGVAGLTLAYWLKQYNFSVTIVEHAPSLVTGGYKVDVRGSALDILRKMNIYDSVKDADTDMQSALLIDKKGRVINKMTSDDFGHRTIGDLEIIRGSLCQILRNTIQDIEIIFSDSIQSVSQTDSNVKINFKNNSSREFDLVIGADGVHSNLRKLVFGKETPYTNNLGLYLCVFSIPNYLMLDRIELQYSEIGRIASIWCARENKEAKACFGFASTETIDLNNPLVQQDMLKKIYADLEWEFPKIFKMMSESLDFYFDSASLICMDRWSLGRVALIGDAAYCASPLSGQGISLALIGAYVLAGELYKSNGNFIAAFNQYEEIIRPFVRKNQGLAIKSAKLMRSGDKNKFLFWMLNIIMRIIPGKLVKLLHDLATTRIRRAANSIVLKNY
jgi:2-polyprenyl-6-methoxyphenol hydroxylase-like FAD-dependent oxidoreductase